MATNKAEREMVKKLTEARDMARALRWPEYGVPERISASSNYIEGYDFNAYRVDREGVTGTVYEAWSTRVSHGEGKYQNHRSGSRDGRPLYRTRLDALRALRLQLTEKYSRILAEIDKQIAAEAARPRDEADACGALEVTTRNESEPS